MWLSNRMATHHSVGIRNMTGRLRRRTAVVVAVAAVGMGALTGCTSGSPAPQHTVLTTKAAGAYYQESSCTLRVADEGFSVALLNAEQSTDSTGPDLDSLKAAALSYQKASRAAAAHLADPTVVWPTSVRKSIAVLVHDLRAMVRPLGEMATGTQMSDEQAGYKDLPDNTPAAAAIKDIHSKLGLSDGSSSCPAPKPRVITVPEATGILITGTGYTFHAPAGWTLPPQPMKADSYAVSAQPDANGVYDTVNVLVGTLNTDTLADQQQRAAQYLEQVIGATQVKIRPRVEIAGEESVHISSVLSHQGIAEWSEQYSVSHGGATLTISFGFARSAESQTDREALAESVLASWAWD